MREDVAEFARRHIAGRAVLPAAVWPEMAGVGLFRIGLPAAYGGDGGTLSDIAEVEFALAAHGGVPGIAGSWTGHQMVARFFLAGFGSAEQKAVWLPRMATGASTAAVAISEPGVGAHPKHLTTSARRVTDGFVLDGRKAFVSNGPIADLFIVLALSGEGEGRKWYSCFLVPQDTEGLARVALAVPDPALHCGLVLEHCHLPASALLGGEGDAYPQMALPFRDAEDAVGLSGLAGVVGHLVGIVAKGLAADASVEEAASVGGLVGLASLIAHAADGAAAALDRGEMAQGLMIGARQLAADLLPRLRARADARAEPLLRSIETSLSVARGPRAQRAAGLAMAVRGGD